MSNITKIVLGLFLMAFLTSVLVAAGFMPAPENAKLPDAAMQGDKATVAALLKQGTDVNAAQGDGTTALHWAAYHGDLEMTKALLKAGANVKAATRIGSMTPLYMACQNGNPAVIEALLNAGAKASEVNTNGTTALMTAAASGSSD